MPTNKTSAGLAGAALILGPLTKVASAIVTSETLEAALAENKLTHIFDKPAHNLNGLLEFFGSREGVTKEVVSALAQAGKITTTVDGRFTAVVQ